MRDRPLRFLCGQTLGYRRNSSHAQGMPRGGANGGGGRANCKNVCVCVSCPFRSLFTRLFRVRGCAFRCECVTLTSPRHPSSLAWSGSDQGDRTVVAARMVASGMRKATCIPRTVNAQSSSYTMGVKARSGHTRAPACPGEGLAVQGVPVRYKTAYWHASLAPG